MNSFLNFIVQERERNKGVNAEDQFHSNITQMNIQTFKIILSDYIN